MVSDEGNTSGIFVPGATAGAPRHDWLCLTGGAIGQGLPVATGAAVACPDRQVLSLEADGSAMYTLQSLWTQAREGLDVTTVLFNNGSYAILELELGRVGAGDPGPRAREMLDLSARTSTSWPWPGHGCTRHPGHERRGVHRPARSGPWRAPGRRSSRPSSAESGVSLEVFVDLNADVGEGAGAAGDDEVLLDLVTSASVACGVHAGDAGTMRRTVEAAARRGVVVGAHPSYPDRAGFGRRPMDMPPAEVTEEVLAQVGALDTVARACGTVVRFVKPHGALYLHMADDARCARAVAEALRAARRPGPAGPGGVGAVEVADVGRGTSRHRGLRRPRLPVQRPPGATLAPGAVLTDPAEVARRALRLAVDHEATTVEGTVIGLTASSICVHGDTPGAGEAARQVRTTLEGAGVTLLPFVS